MGSSMQQAGQSMQNVAGEASGAASSVVDTAKEESRELARETKDQARELFDDVRTTTKQELDSLMAGFMTIRDQEHLDDVANWANAVLALLEDEAEASG